MEELDKIDGFLKTATERLADSLSKFSETGRPVWESPVFRVRYLNPASGAKYNIQNSTILSMLAEDKGYDMPFYLTAKQGMDAGMMVMKGSKADYVLHSFVSKKELTKKNEKGIYEPMLDEDGNPRFYMRKGEKLSPVFNLKNFTGEIPKRFTNLLNAHEKIATKDEVATVLQSLIDTMPTPLTRNIESTGQHNYYSPAKDSINVAPSSLFKSLAHEFHTIAHEISHSYGHFSRKNRESLSKYSENHEFRGFEEVVANLSAQRIANHFGIEFEGEMQNELRESFLANHASYDLGWAHAGFKDNPEKIWQATVQADQTSSSIIQLMTEDLKAKLERNLTLAVPEIIQASMVAKKESEAAYEQKQSQKTTTKRKYKR